TVPATTLIYPLSLHDALPIFPELYRLCSEGGLPNCNEIWTRRLQIDYNTDPITDDAFVEYQQASLYDLYRKVQPIYVTEAMKTRSEEHTSELQSRRDLVCRLL